MQYRLAVIEQGLHLLQEHHDLRGVDIAELFLLQRILRQLQHFHPSDDFGAVRLRDAEYFAKRKERELFAHGRNQIADGSRRREILHQRFDIGLHLGSQPPNIARREPSHMLPPQLHVMGGVEADHII